MPNQTISEQQWIDLRLFFVSYDLVGGQTHWQVIQAIRAMRRLVAQLGIYQNINIKRISIALF